MCTCYHFIDTRHYKYVMNLFINEKKKYVIEPFQVLFFFL